MRLSDYLKVIVIERNGFYYELAFFGIEVTHFPRNRITVGYKPAHQRLVCFVQKRYCDVLGVENEILHYFSAPFSEIGFHI